MHIHVDSDRDGRVDDAPGFRSWLPTRGAILLVNCDNDGGRTGGNATSNRDSADLIINGARDVLEISPLDLRKSSELPLDQASVILSVDTTPPDYSQLVRIFDGRAAGATEIIGPYTGGSITFTEADFSDGKIELGMEAIRFPSRAMGGTSIEFNGRVSLKLQVVGADGTELHSETVEVRVAPWIVFNHMDLTEKVYVARFKTHVRGDTKNLLGNDNFFVNRLKKIIGGKLVVIEAGDHNGDRWAQDIMEIGHSALPGHKLTTAIRTPRLRLQGDDLFAQYPGRKLLGPDYGYYVTNSLIANSSLDSFGNLECSPPIPGYPFGRVVYGEPASGGHPEMKVEMRALLEGQGLQSPIRLDTGWLVVGHVDEFISFIPDASGTHKFKVAIASPRLAVKIVRNAHAKDPSAALFQGITFNDGTTMKAIEFKAGYSQYADFGTTAQILGSAEFLATQTVVKKIIDSQKEILKRELGLAASDFIELPILFDKIGSDPTQYIAFTPGSVNMLVVTNKPNDIDLVIPKPLGPVLRGKCQFEAKILAAFAGNSAVTPHFVDCFLTYHTLAGEIHCGTNSKRIPPARNWWG